jgi:flagellar hook-basal body complex protein FliE
MNRINPIGPIQEGLQAGKAGKIAQPGQGQPSFSETLKTFMKDVNGLQSKADESIQRMAAGEITDVHQVMTSVEEAGVAFNMMMEIRNKVLDAYQEVMRMRL